MKKLFFIGAGKMASAIAGGLTASGKFSGGELGAFDPDQKSAEAFQKASGVSVDTNSPECGINESSALLLAVKPQVIASLAVYRDLMKDKLIISIAAGISIDKLKEITGSSRIIRVMPNTPALVGEGMILYDCLDVSPEMEKAFLHAFSGAGKLDKIPEEKIDAASALSGCGPAFVYAFAEALADGAVECGVPRDKASEYAAQTLYGAAKMLLTYGHPADLKDAVCSPGGTTIAGIHALEHAGFRGATMDAITAAYKRTLELKK